MPSIKTVQPYPAGTKWTFSTRRGTYTQTQELALYAEPECSSMSDEYLPDEANAVELWRMWVDRYVTTYHQKYPGKVRPGEMPIYWSVTLPTRTGVFEAAPYAPNILNEDFLTHYTHPVHADSGERLNWLRLPVLDGGWNSAAADKGGFIQEATGWKPSALQPVMDVVQIGRAAGLHIPAVP